MENYAEIYWALVNKCCLFFKSLQTPRPSITLILRGKFALLSIIAYHSTFRSTSSADSEVRLYFELSLSGNQSCYVWYKGHTNHLLSYGSLNSNLLTYSARLSGVKMEVGSSLSADTVVMYIFAFSDVKGALSNGLPVSPFSKDLSLLSHFSPCPFLGSFSNGISFSYFFLADKKALFFIIIL